MPTARQDQLARFAASHAPGPVAHLAPASADASFRSYWRVTGADGWTGIIMDAPPEHEDLGPWLDIGARLRAAGLHAPEVLAVERGLGFVLMEDLGDETFLRALDGDSADRLYADALDTLLQLQTRVDPRGLPAYDRNLLVAELELMPEWFLGRHLGFTPGCEEWDEIEAAFTFLVGAALAQPRAFVHRDYHSRNLLLAEPGRPALIDYQDAVVGPVTYDLVSLLRDCYIQWPQAQVEAWAEGYRERLQAAHLLPPETGAAGFLRAFDLMGVQRHLKVLGIFCRLWYRDGKPQYLADLPLTFHYAVDVAARYPELQALAALLRRAAGNADLARPRP